MDESQGINFEFGNGDYDEKYCCIAVWLYCCMVVLLYCLMRE